MMTILDTSTHRDQCGRSTATNAIAVVVAVIVLAGAAFGVYALTRPADKYTPVVVTVKAVFTDWQQGDEAAARKHMSSKALADLFAIKASEGTDLTFGGCRLFGPKLFPRICTWSRPGGQLAMRVQIKDKVNVIDLITFGPAGLPPETPTTPST